MLVLTRTPGQRIVLPELGITIQMVEVQGGRVRVGIDAPADVRILRQELLDSEHIVGRPASRRAVACHS